MTKLTLLLAQGPDKPDGDLSDRLVLNLCLTHAGLIDLNAYHHAPEPWLATRDTGGTDHRAFEVVRIDEGWALQSNVCMDDPVWAFDGHVFRPGELVRLRGPGGDVLLYRIVGSESA